MKGKGEEHNGGKATTGDYAGTEGDAGGVRYKKQFRIVPRRMQEGGR